MSYLVDTNVISELIKREPNQGVVTFLNRIDESDLYISVLTVGELRKGIELLKDSKKKQELVIWLEQELIPRFNDRLLTISLPVTERWGRLMAKAKKTLSAIDSLIAATALHHDLALVTRNTSDFEIPTLEVFNPWL